MKKEKTIGTLADLQKDLESTDKKLADLQSGLSELAAVSASLPTKKEMQAALHYQNLDFQNKVDELTTLLNRNDDKIEILLIRIKNLKKDFMKIAGRTPSPLASADPKPAQLPETTLPNDAATGNGGVKEQNLQ